jgi:hypothetical protein
MGKSYLCHFPGKIAKSEHNGHELLATQYYCNTNKYGGYRTVVLTLSISTVHRTRRLDLWCVLALVALWWLFFWRILTPNPANQQSLIEGDFSGQFVAYAGYQAERLAQGQIALWDPFNNSGHPFLADTQAAALYPPRLITLAVTNLATKISGSSVTPGILYSALQLEMAVHALITSLTIYVLLRRLIPAVTHYASFAGALAAALTFTYGGYLTGYPPLQLAILEAVTWLPLALIGLHEATRISDDRLQWRWFALSGIAFALSILAGHPQTNLEFGYLCAGYLGYRVAIIPGWSVRRRMRNFVAALIVFGALAGALSAAQIIPTFEFSRLTARNANFTFVSEGNGFPLYDVAQVLLPGFLSQWSPLYFGVAGFALALFAVWRRAVGSRFWLIAAVLGLGLAYGHNTILYDIAYNIVPGFNLFRGQERAALIVAVASAILVGIGAANLAELAANAPPDRYQLALRTGFGSLTSIFGLFAWHWLTTPNDDSRRLGLIMMSVIVSGAMVVLVNWSSPWRPLGVVALIVFDLFTFAHSSANYDNRPALDRLTPPPLIQTLQTLHTDPNDVYRIDGQRGILENYGTLYGLPDIRGISPLRLDRYERLLSLPEARLWNVLAVRYVMQEGMQLSVPSTIIGTGSDPTGKLNLHKLTDAQPFARLMYRTWIVADDAGQFQALANPDIDLNHTVVLSSDPAVKLPADMPTDSRATVTSYGPEAFAVQTHSTADAILDLAQVNYPGWQATIDDQPVSILRADLALSAVVVPAGDHVVSFRYQPVGLAVGAVVSLAAVILLAVGGLIGIISGLTIRRKAKISMSANS